jgi:predicted nuclease of restriction endonuclease-like (RecB) superfamily
MTKMRKNIIIKNENVAQAVLQIPWGHNILIMQKIKEEIK